jgi:hypothetical protein
MMPRYLFELHLPAPPAAGGRPDRAEELRCRFPEVSVEHRYVVRDDGHAEVWVCRAPSAEHLRRFAEDAELQVTDIRGVAEVGPPGRRTT